MKSTTGRGYGRVVVACWLLSGCGGGGSDGGAGAGMTPVPTAGMTVGGSGGTPSGGSGVGGTAGAAAGTGGTGGSAAPDAGVAGAPADAGCRDGGCATTDACAASGCKPADECSDPSTNDCGDAVCMPTAGGHECVCDRHATFAAGKCTCDLTGTFAVRVKAMLSWEDALFGSQVVIEGGTAESVGSGLLTIVRDGATLRAESKNCGSNTPDLCSPFFSEAYGQSFPQSMWDSASIPTQSVTLQLETEAPGGTFSTQRSAAFLGFRFIDGVDPLGPFPASATDSSLLWMDDDDDDAPGVTAVVTAPGAKSARCNLDYAYLPVDATTLGRAKRVQLGARTISHLQGSIEDCDLLTGQLITDAANGRVYGCTLANDAPCSLSQSDFLDTQAKGQSIGTATFVMVRLSAANPSCEDARSASFPP